MERLEAVNDILRRVGALVVPALDTGGTSIQAQAERQLDDVDLRVQSLGWHWNRRTLTLSPDESSQIPVASIATPRGGILDLDTAGETEAYGVEVIVKDGLLTLLPDMTQEFESDVTVEIVERIPFNEIPVLFAAWMVAEAAFDLNRRYMQDTTRDQALVAEKQQARVSAMRQAIRLADVNVLKSDDVVSVHGRQRLPNWSVR